MLHILTNHCLLLANCAWCLDHVLPLLCGYSHYSRHHAGLELSAVAGTALFGLAGRAFRYCCASTAAPALQHGLPVAGSCIPAALLAIACHGLNATGWRCLSWSCYFAAVPS